MLEELSWTPAWTIPTADALTRSNNNSTGGANDINDDSVPFVCPTEPAST